MCVEQVGVTLAPVGSSGHFESQACNTPNVFELEGVTYTFVWNF